MFDGDVVSFDIGTDEESGEDTASVFAIKVVDPERDVDRLELALADGPPMLMLEGDNPPSLPPIMQVPRVTSTLPPGHYVETKRWYDKGLTKKKKGIKQYWIRKDELAKRLAGAG